MGAAQEAEKEADLGYLTSEVPRAIDRTLDGIGRINQIVRAMKEFAHPDRKEKEPADLNRALLMTLTVARSELKLAAEVETDLGELPPVMCHLGDIGQVLLNLLVNAAHAVQEAVGKTGARGTISISTRREGDSVLIAVRDTGCGVPRELRNRIFEPFFTTKEVGRGTGQGLAIARAVVVEKHGGSLTFQSEPGKGTTFFIRLPIGATDEVPAGAPR